MKLIFRGSDFSGVATSALGVGRSGLGPQQGGKRLFFESHLEPLLSLGSGYLAFIVIGLDKARIVIIDCVSLGNRAPIDRAPIDPPQLSLFGLAMLLFLQNSDLNPGVRPIIDHL